MSTGASRAPLSRAFTRARSTLPAPAAAQQMPHQRRLGPAVPNHQAASSARAPGAHAWVGQGRAHLGSANRLLGNAAIPRRGIPCGEPGPRHDYSLAGRDAACERRPPQRAGRGLQATAGARPWDTSAEPPPPPRSSWRGCVGPCHGVAVGPLWPPRSVRTCCPLVAPREDGSRAGDPATARSVAVTPQPLCRDPQGLILRGDPRLGKTSPATQMRNIPERQHTMIS